MKTKSAVIRVLTASTLSPTFWVAIFFSSLTLFSIIVNIAQIDIYGALLSIWSKYIKYRDWLFSPITYLIPFEVSGSIKDSITIYFFLGFTNLKAHQISKGVFHPNGQEAKLSWVGLVLLWPRTLKAHMSNLKVANFFRHQIVDDKGGTDEISMGLNTMLTHGKLYPLILLFELFVAVSAVIWGSI